ncbi:MAG: lipid-A-disaccharide synthase N-terminal domain-containing protein [Phycisphaeraceae bacterium]
MFRLLAISFMLAVLAAPAVAVDDGDIPESTSTETIGVKVRIPGANQIELTRFADGRLLYTVYWKDRPPAQYNAEQFTRMLYHEHTGQPFIYLLFNISNPWGFAWVSLGLLGQVLFTGRMIIQWFVSEKEKRSVIPISFWWMSLIGSSMLLVYFVWRKDIVGVLGMCTGWFIYLRNLMLIYAHRKRTDPHSPDAA